MTPTHHHPDSGHEITVLFTKAGAARVYCHTARREETWWAHEVARYAAGASPFPKYHRGQIVFGGRSSAVEGNA